MCDEDRRVWRVVWGTLNESDDCIRWPASETAAKVLERWWNAGQRERVREYIRRLTWSFSDEAGQLIWSAPETITELVVAVPELYKPYADMMICLASEEPPFVPGVLWGIGRLGPRARESLDAIRERVVEFFEGEDSRTVGLAAWAMGEAGYTPSLPYLRGLEGREEPVGIYIGGTLHEKTVGQWAKEAVQKMRHDR
jgi:hypothetical protein